MGNAFSIELIARAQQIFERRSGRAVSEEETEIYLEKLAQVGGIALKTYTTKQKQKQKGGEKS